ncbi:Polysaccharide pyruvyl transferase [Gracilibacillus orientalis]|uniref:Polysaccharide pyruvyl transferase n=1 Tax=Gracilibacillus orientalis TaxID=334253 RepID=A0A1I4PDD4_9BACI|nr:polysaccharide pyruvyl transferase family protein [Gracilibacillus orientalis]SFM25710.1 Polysaccharide pyruvyl transferase [Gracilibacillus orientalis]
MRNVKLGITGPMSESNFGDFAMFINNVYELGVNEIVAFSYNKGFSQKIINDYLNSYKIKNVEVILKESLDGPEKTNKDINKKVGYLPFNAPTLTPIDILHQIDNYSELESNIKEIDVLVVNGGGYFNHLWNNSLWRQDMLKKIIAPILVANQLNKPIYFTGNSYGPFDQSEEFFNYIFNYIKNVRFGVRDKMYSNVYLSRIGIDSQKQVFIPDDLFIINNDLLNLPRKEFKDLSNIGKYIAVEIYYPLDELKDIIEDLKRFSDEIYSKYGYSIIFLPFDFNNGGMNQGEFLKNNLEHFYLYDISKTGYLPIEDVAHIIKQAELVFCTRYHALVLAVGQGTPVINMMKKVCNDHRYYFNKNYGILQYVFEGIQFNEMDFIKRDLVETLEYLEENILNVINSQKQVFNNKRYSENLTTLRNKRLNYLDNILNRK